jgi:hypothetical protein
MRWSRILILAALAGALAHPAASTEPGQSVNGCGPDGILGRIVPNRIRVVNCELEKACNAHDICYGKCLLGGALYGNPTCNDDEARRKRRLVCDDALFAEIGTANDNRLACRAAASLYKSFVRAAGTKFFFGIAPRRHDTEELYRVPRDYLDGGGFAIEFGVQVEGKLDRNYAAVDALVRYAESNPGKLSQAEIEAALASIEAHAMREGYALAFKSDPAGPELVLEPVWRDTENPKDDIVVWTAGR